MLKEQALAVAALLLLLSSLVSYSKVLQIWNQICKIMYKNNNKKSSILVSVRLHLLMINELHLYGAFLVFLTTQRAYTRQRSSTFIDWWQRLPSVSMSDIHSQEQTQ